uniref:Uncharacterized protein n=1 Tax=Rhizophora mucronata TaxID=61149 RepID=A0A2P2Q6Z3_RHIMU
MTCVCPSCPISLSLLCINIEIPNQLRVTGEHILILSPIASFVCFAA